MKFVSSLVAVILFGSNVFAIESQSWSCRLNLAKSKEVLSRAGKNIGLTTVESVSVKISDGKIVDGHIVANSGFYEGGWKFTEPSPSERNSQDYSVGSLREISGGKIRFEIGSHGWDHFDYTITINPKKNSATVSEYGYYDCGDPGKAIGALDCQKQ